MSPGIFEVSRQCASVGTLKLEYARMTVACRQQTYRAFGIEPDAPIEGPAYMVAHAVNRVLPTTLCEAANRLKACGVAREPFGDVFVDHYATSREWEERESRRAVTDWELEWYFEII